MDGFPLRIAGGSRALWGGVRIKGEVKTEIPKAELGDNDLVAQALKGRIASFKELVNRYQKRTYLYARGMVHNTDDASDLSQEAFVRVYRNLRSFDDAYPFKVWLFHILANLCKNHLRQKKSRERVMIDSDEQTYQAVSEIAGPETAVRQSEIQSAIWKAINRLPEKFREIIILSHFQDMSYEQIAQVLDIPRGSVMSRLYYARSKLREIIEEMGVEL